MKIVGFETRIIEHPTPGVFNPAWTPGGDKIGQGFLFLKLITDEGIEGYSTGLRYRVFKDARLSKMDKGILGGTQAKKAVDNYLETFLIGRDPTNIEDIVLTLQNASFFGKGRLWFIEIACWDLLGKKAGLPVYKLMGGFRDRIKGYASWGSTKTPEAAHEAAKQYLAYGYKAIKVRSHFDTIDEDVDQIAAVRDAVGPNVDIMVDVNQARCVNINYRVPEWDLKRAIYTARKLEPLHIAWLEEPLKQWDYKGLQELRQHTCVPIAGGEYDENIYGFQPLLDSFDILQPDIARAGGIWGTRKIGILAEARNKPCIIHTWGDGLIMHPSLHLAAAMTNCPYFELPDERPNWSYQVRDTILENPIQIGADGFVQLPQESGLGYHLDWDKIEKYTVQE